MIEGLNNFQTVGGNKKGFGETLLQEGISGNKYLSHGRSANFAGFEDNFKA